jgi:hypothetical protein
MTGGMHLCAAIMDELWTHVENKICMPITVSLVLTLTHISPRRIECSSAESHYASLWYIQVRKSKETESKNVPHVKHI